MPALLIHVVDNKWVAEVAGTGTRYTFVGASQSHQETALQQLAVAMQEGKDALTKGIPEILQLPGGTKPEDVVKSMFGTADQIVLRQRPVYAAVGEEVLLDAGVLEEAGKALARAL